MLLAVFAIVIFYGELKMIESKQIKGFLKKLKELYGKTEVIAPIVFRDADILIQNPLSGGKNAVRYEVMDTLIETEHYFLLFTKEWQITIIAKDGMDSGEKDRFLKMMEEKHIRLLLKVVHLLTPWIKKDQQLSLNPFLNYQHMKLQVVSY